MANEQRIGRPQVGRIVAMAIAAMFAISGATLASAAPKAAAGNPPKSSAGKSSSEGIAKQPVEDDHAEQYEAATDIDPKQAIDAGFTLLDYERKGDDTIAARLIEKEMMPDLVKGLPWPEAGFLYALKDLDGDGGPELFLVIKHWKVCDPSCPVRVYKFYDGAWKLLIEQKSVTEAIRLPRTPREKPQIAFMDNGPNLDGPTVVRFYRLDSDKFVFVRKLVGGKKEKK
jgi:hypothetical protein